MTLYAIFDPQPGRPDLPAAIPESFSWFAALLPPVFLLRHGLYLECAAWAVKLVVLVLLSRVIGGDAAFVLYLLVALWFGLAAAGLRRHALTWRGWTFRNNRVALSRDMALLESLS